MLRYKLIHPEILEVLGTAGHGSKVLIADGNYPHTTGSNSAARRVFLNLTPGIPKVTDILAAFVDAIPIEAAEVMLPATGPEPPIFAEFRQILPHGIDLKGLGRFEFYEAARGRDLALVIASAEQRIYANLLLTIGVVKP